MAGKKHKEHYHIGQLDTCDASVYDPTMFPPVPTWLVEPNVKYQLISHTVLPGHLLSYSFEVHGQGGVLR